MKKAVLKIKDNSGASILLAIFFMLIAVMVSAVIVSGALSASKAAAYKNDAQKAYLTVYSAADFISTELQQAEYDEKEKEFVKQSVVFKDLLTEAMTELKGKETMAEFKDSKTIKSEKKTFKVSANDFFDVVNVEYQMDKTKGKEEYEITMDLSLDDGHTYVGEYTDFQLSLIMTLNGDGHWELSNGSPLKAHQLGEARA